MLKYIAQKKGLDVNIHLVSLEDPFEDDLYDMVFIGGGQDYEQKVIAKDLPNKKEAMARYIENNGVMLAICGGYQLLGKYYETTDGDRIEGLGLLPHYTINQTKNRFIGDIVVENDAFNEEYIGFENHKGCTYLGENEKPLGIVKLGYGNNGKDRTEGAIYKNVFCSYFHGPLLVRNPHLAERLVHFALNR